MSRDNERLIEYADSYNRHSFTHSYIISGDNERLIEYADSYNRHSFTHNYIIGFTDEVNVYYMYVKIKTVRELLGWVKLDRESTSNGGGYKLRMRKIGKKEACRLRTMGAIKLCGYEEFRAIVRTSKYNSGEIFEKLITEQVFGQKWFKDSIPFNKDGDVTADGIAYQIKYSHASMASGKMLEALDA